MSNKVQVFHNENIDLPVKEVDGQVYFEAEAAAIGLGICFVAKSGNKVVRWSRVNSYLGVATSGNGKIAKGSWITEPQFYKLAFKASNDVAEKFQNWVASEVLPSIRKHGAYLTDQKIEEIWKTYPKYTFIEVSNLGRVRIKDRWVPCNGGERLVKGHILKQWVRKNGYVEVSFGMNRKTVNLLVHRIVAICHIPNPDNLPEVNHKDNNPKNNVASNLEWCSREYNEAYKKNFGTSHAQIQGRPIVAVNQNTGEVFWFESQHEAGRQLGIDQSSITKVVKGKNHKAGGYWFTYADENAVEITRTKFGEDIANKVEKLMNENCN